MKERQVQPKNYYIIGSIYIALIIITVLSAFHGAGFKMFSSYTLVIYTVVAVWEFIHERKVSRKLFAAAGTAVVYYIALSIWNEDAGIGSGVLVSSSLLCMVVMDRLAIRKKQLILLERFCFVSVIAMTAVSFQIHSSLANYMAFAKRGVNPNSWAQMALFLAMLFAALHVGKGKAACSFVILCAAVTAYHCRTRFVTIAALLFAVLYWMPAGVFKNNRMRLLAVLVIAFGTVFPFLYLWMYRSGFQLSVYGKDIFSGRESIWNHIFQTFAYHPRKMLTGLGSNYNAGALNTHSVYIGLLTDFGVIGYFLYFSFVMVLISEKGRYVTFENTKNALLMFIIGNLFMGITETTMLWSGIFCLSYISLGVAAPINYNERSLSYRIRKGSCKWKKSGIRIKIGNGKRLGIKGNSLLF